MPDFFTAEHALRSGGESASAFYAMAPGSSSWGGVASPIGHDD
jgi:hypothetical protein